MTEAKESSNHDPPKIEQSNQEDASTTVDDDTTEPIIAANRSDEDKEFLTGFKLYVIVGALAMVTFLATLNSSMLVTPTFLCYVAIFELGSLISGVSRSSDMLIVGRTVSGMGTSGLWNGGLTIIAGAAPIEKRPVLLSCISSLAATASVTGPLIGGLLTEDVSWRWFQRIGYYLPFAIAGTAFTAIGTGLLCTLDPSSSNAKWIGYQMITGAGRGMANQQVIIAVQNNLPKHELAVGVAVLIFFQSLGNSVFVSVSNTIFNSSLILLLGQYAPFVNATEVIAAGATGLRSAVMAAQLSGVLLAYNEALTRTFYLSIGLSCVAFFTSWGIGWKSVKKVQPITKIYPDRMTSMTWLRMKETWTSRTSSESQEKCRSSIGSGVFTATTPVRPSTPDNRNASIDDISPAPRPNPFASPITSRPPSSRGSSSAVQGLTSRYFHSRRVKKGEIEQPWKEKKDPKEKWVTIIPLIGLLAGVAVAAFLIYDGLHSVVHHKYCSIMSEDFSGGFNTSCWTKEAEVGGFGNGEFEQTTLDDENVYIQDGKLIIRPTLQNASLIDTNNVINLTADGTCSSASLSNCVTQTNLTTGEIIQPVKSGRINTKKGATIKYGRVEVTATLPSGDWLWPAIWMLPVNDTYGPWPLSGEIDIMESRGNNYTYSTGGNNIISSTLHWGPNADNDGWWRTNVKRSALHTTYAAKEHTFGLEWSEKYLFTYVDSRLLQVLYTKFDEPLWQRGNFPLSDSNGTRLVDVWAETDKYNTPFDQEFYLILNVAVGGTNKWFEDGVAGKPWVDASPTAKKDFWDARNVWGPTWDQGGAIMSVSKVDMWQQCDGDE
ncbi:hypothetical protein B7494_g2010 [Chlorociboria aeruginascens]|nr:hypothetical protein B7494_g2010 [Chlorociboria aeruginascens]